MFLVAGVTGNTGRVVAARLLAAGAAVRVLVRSAEKGAAWAEAGAEVAVGDLDSPADLGAALAGVQGAYLLLPPIATSPQVLADQRVRVRALAAALREAGVAHGVFLSSVGAHLPTGTGPIRSLYDAEAVLAEAVPRMTFVRAAYFMENWGSALGTLADGIFPTFIDPDLAFDMVATADIGRVSADALLHGGRPGAERIELSSGPAISPRQVAAALSALAGRDLQVVHPPLSAVVPTFTGFGMSADMAGLYEEMIGTLNTRAGDLWEGGAGVWTVRGPTRIEDVLRGMLAGA